MNKISALALFFGALLVSGSASAEHHVSRLDPSGAEMCFDGSGAKAPLAACAGPASFASRSDPSGAAMCFDALGAKAPLAVCETAPRYVSAVDPSGAPMCFDGSGAKAPLSSCAVRPPEIKLAALLAPLTGARLADR